MEDTRTPARIANDDQIDAFLTELVVVPGWLDAVLRDTPCEDQTLIFKLLIALNAPAIERNMARMFTPRPDTANVARLLA